MLLKRKIILLSVALFIGSIFFVNVTLSENTADRKFKDGMYQDLNLFGDALSIIQSQYVDELKSKDLVYGALKGMLSSLDPYSEFLTPQEYNELKSNTEGRFGGVGMEITIKDGLVTVVSPIENTPAWDAGVKTGDIIVKIDDKVIKDYSLGDAVRALRGQEGTQVKVTIWRQGLKDLLELSLTRTIIKLEDIKDTWMIEPGIGYVRLVEFSAETPRDLVNALSSLKEQNMKGLVLDLRNNPGGLLEAATTVAEMFLDEGKLIVSTKGRGEDAQVLEYRSKKNSTYNDLLIVVLINEGSASGSEILAGALQDYKRAIIVGRRTFGKGSVQTILPLSDGSAVKLTTSKYFTPLGRSIHGEGIEPNIDVEYLQIIRQQPNANIPEEVAKTFGGDANSQDEFMQRYMSDNQLIRAVDILKGLLIYKNE
jgi:carboxyl-terminal processing protease